MIDPRTIDSGSVRLRGHGVHIDNRQLVSVTGVKDVESFNDQEVMLITESGGLRIEGSSLHITKLNLDDGQVILEGEIAALDYEDDPQQKGSLFSRMFR